MSGFSLVAHIGRGRDAARTIGEIAERAGVTRRVVERAVQQARNEGVPVATGPDGVWLATSRTELEQQYSEHRERAMTQLRGLRGIRRAMDAMPPEQIEMGLAS